jgi:hypothetical protein
MKSPAATQNVAETQLTSSKSVSVIGDDVGAAIGDGVFTIAQLWPFHCSISRRSSSELADEDPTAKHIVAAGHATPLSQAERPGGAGTGSACHDNGELARVDVDIALAGTATTAVAMTTELTVIALIPTVEACLLFAAARKARGCRLHRELLWAGARRRNRRVGVLAGQPCPAISARASLPHRVDVVRSILCGRCLLSR